MRLPPKATVAHCLLSVLTWCIIVMEAQGQQAPAYDVTVTYTDKRQTHFKSARLIWDYDKTPHRLGFGLVPYSSHVDDAQSLAFIQSRAGVGDRTVHSTKQIAVSQIERISFGYRVERMSEEQVQGMTGAVGLKLLRQSIVHTRSKEKLDVSGARLVVDPNSKETFLKTVLKFTGGGESLPFSRGAEDFLQLYSYDWRGGPKRAFGTGGGVSMVMNDSLTTSLFDIDVMSVKENQAKGDWSGAPLKRAEENLRRKFNADQKLIQEILLIPAVGK